MSRDLPAGTGVALAIPVVAAVATSLGVHARDNSTYVLLVNRVVISGREVCLELAKRGLPDTSYNDMALIASMMRSCSVLH